MADNYIGGADGYVKLGATAYNFAKWTCEFDPGNIKFFAFGSSFQITLPSGKSAKLSFEGPYNQGNMPLTPGTVYEFHLGWMVGIEIVVSARLGPLKVSNEIKQGGEPAPVSCEADSHGSFTFAIL